MICSSGFSQHKGYLMLHQMMYLYHYHGQPQTESFSIVIIKLGFEHGISNYGKLLLSPKGTHLRYTPKLTEDIPGSCQPLNMQELQCWIQEEPQAVSVSLQRKYNSTQHQCNAIP